MDGSQQNLLDSFPMIFQADSEDSWERNDINLHYECRVWVSDVLARFGTQYTIQSWLNLYRRGLKLNSRLAISSRG